MTTTVQFHWLWRVVLGIWLAAIGFSTLPTFAYDSQVQSHTGTKLGYDDGSATTAEYGGVAVSSVYEHASDLGGTRTPFAVFAKFLAAEGGETLTAYRAINPAYADTTEASGQFYQSGAAGRLGNDGIYANTTPEGAIAEFQYHNPGVDPAVFEVQYPASPTLNISPPSGYFSSPLPFTGDANILTAPSLRAPGTLNLLIRDGAVPGARLP